MRLAAEVVYHILVVMTLHVVLRSTVHIWAETARSVCDWRTVKAVGLGILFKIDIFGCARRAIITSAKRKSSKVDILRRL